MSRSTESAVPDLMPAADTGPAAERVRAEVARLREHQAAVQAVPFESRLAALAGLSARMLDRDPALTDLLAQPGAAFLAEFLQPSSLRKLCSRELPDPAMLSRFVTVGSGRAAIRLMPRGLVCHWLAGNVPLLGALSWTVSVLVGNLNLLRLSSRQDDPVTPLLRALADNGEPGATLAAGSAVFRFDRDDAAAHAAMSEAADVRIAWGGHEAVQAVRSLPARWDCEDVILGPRVSLAVVDPAVMTAGATGRLATDVIYFDQQACSSPQVVFVRGRRGDVSFDQFVGELAEQIARKSNAVPRHTLDHGETYRIVLDRTRVLLSDGDVLRDEATAWTVALVDAPDDALRCANRFVQVVPFESLEETLPHIPRNVQTVVTRLSAADLDAFTDAASSRGVCRFPAPGEGNRFETPWDGVPLVARLTRWVTRSEPGP